MTYTLKDSQTTVTGNIGASTTFPIWGTSWTAGSSYTLTKASWNLKTSSSSSGAMTCKIYSSTGTLPNTLLATADATVDANVLTGSYAFIDFTFNSGVSITNGTRYVLVIEFATGTNILMSYASGVTGEDRDYYYSGAWNNDGNDTQLGFKTWITDAPTAPRFQINIGDSWKTVASVKINIGDVWKDVPSAQINIGDSWKTI